MQRASTAAMRVMQTWDASLRDRMAARGTLADDATYEMPGDEPISCTNGDQIVALVRSWKGKLPDIKVVALEPIGSSVLARLRQPAWGEDADRYESLTVDEGLIRRLEDHPDRDVALAAISGSAP